VINKHFELDRLRSALISRGLGDGVVETIVAKANKEIESAMADKMREAMDRAIELGIDKKSTDFINDLRPAPGAYEIDTFSGLTDFSIPPFPMLPRLLQNAKPMKDGSGVYKVIPVGKQTPRETISNNIFDSQKAINTKRLEDAKAQYNKMAPAASATQFRTATSKQSQTESWVRPEKSIDFTDDLRDINVGLQEDLEQIIMNVVREYEEFI